MDELFFITLARLGLTGARAQVPVGWKEIYAVVERSLYWDSNAFALNMIQWIIRTVWVFFQPANFMGKIMLIHE